MTLHIHEGKKAEIFSLNDGNIPDPISTENAEIGIVLTILKCQLDSGETDKWNKISNTCMGISQIYTMEKTCTNHKK